MEFHRYALDAQGKWVNAQLLPFIKDAVYLCDCPLKHRLKHVKPSGKAGKRYFTDYFAHISTGSKRKQGEIEGCTGGESMQHRLAKQILRENINSISFVEFMCPNCKQTIEKTFRNCHVKLEMRSLDGQWRYDCMVYNEYDQRIYALEVVHTHYTGQSKVGATRLDGLPIAEFLADNVLDLNDSDIVNKHLFNLLITMKQCNSCAIKEISNSCVQFYKQEQDAWKNLDNIIYNALLDEFNRRQLVSELNLCSSISQQVFIIMEQYKDSIVFSNGIWDNINIKNGCRRVRGGFLTNENFLIQFVRDEWDKLDGRVIHDKIQKLCKEYQNICIHRILVIKMQTVINKISYRNELIFHSCLYPVLKQIEYRQYICSNCGRYGHNGDKCFKKQCFKCGFQHIF